VPCPAGQDCANGTCTGCQPKTCADFLNQCGEISDGCSHTLNCACSTGCCDTATKTCQPGTVDGLCGVGGADCRLCPPRQTCGGGGVPGVCGDSCGGCPDGQICLGGQCCPVTQQCNGACCPSGSGCLNGQCCPGPRLCASGCCPEGQICRGTTCCAPENTCGIACLPAPCDLSRCETCNPMSGTCEVCGGPGHCLRCDLDRGTCFSTCRPGQICVGDDRCMCTAESCPNGRCMDDDTCCPNANVCGNACLPGPCDLRRCETCNPATGTCEVCGGPGTCLHCDLERGTCFSNCPSGTLCDGNERCVAPCASDADCPSGDWCRAGNPNTCRVQIASGEACSASFCAAPNCLQCSSGPSPCPASQVCP
jgi:Cys-rich repeat protein